MELSPQHTTGQSQVPSVTRSFFPKLPSHQLRAEYGTGYDIEQGRSAPRNNRLKQNSFLKELGEGSEQMPLLARTANSRQSPLFFRDIKETRNYQETAKLITDVLDAIIHDTNLQDLIALPSFNKLQNLLKECFQAERSPKEEVFIYKCLRDCLSRLNEGELTTLSEKLSGLNGVDSLPRPSENKSRKDKEKVDDERDRSPVDATTSDTNFETTAVPFLDQLLSLSRLSPEEHKQLADLDDAKRKVKQYLRNKIAGQKQKISPANLAAIIKSAVLTHKDLLHTTDDVGPISKCVFQIIRKLLILIDVENPADISEPDVRAFVSSLLENEDAQLALSHIVIKWAEFCESADEYANDRFASDLARQKNKLLSALDTVEMQQNDQRLKQIARNANLILAAKKAWGPLLFFILAEGFVTWFNHAVWSGEDNNPNALFSKRTGFILSEATINTFILPFFILFAIARYKEYQNEKQ